MKFIDECMKRILFILSFNLFFLNAFSFGVNINVDKANTKKTLITENEKFLIEIQDKSIKIFDHQKKIFLKEIIQNSTILSSVLIPNSSNLAVGCENNVILIDLNSATSIKTWNNQKDRVTDLKVDHKSKRLISYAIDKTICVYDLNSTKILYTIQFNSKVKFIDISQDDLYLITSVENKTQIWNLNNGKKISDLIHMSSVDQSIFKPYTHEIITKCLDDTFRLWDIKTMKIKDKFPLDLENYNSAKTEIKWSAAGKYILIVEVSKSLTLYIFDVYNKRIVDNLALNLNDIRNYGTTKNEEYCFLFDNDKNCCFYNFSNGSIQNTKDDFLALSNNYLYVLDENETLNKFSSVEFNKTNEGFYYVLLKNRSRIFLLTCAANNYEVELINAVNDSRKIINFFQNADTIEGKIKELLFNSESNESVQLRAKLDSLSRKLSKEPIVYPTKLYENELTAQNIINAFKKIKNEINNNDIFIFHFSGMAGKKINYPFSSFFFPKDTSSFLAHDLFQLSEIIDANNQLFIIDANQDNFVREFKNELIQNKSNSQIVNRNRIFIALKGIAVDNYYSTSGGALTYAFVNNKAPLSNAFSSDYREQNSYDYNLFNSTKEIREDKSLEFEIFRESDYYDFKFKENRKSRAINVVLENNEPEKNVNTIGKGQTLSVVVGVNSYKYFNSLQNSIIDAEKISKILMEKYGHKVILLKDISSSNFRDSLVAYSSKYKFEEGSQFLFYFAGHGFFDNIDQFHLLFSDSKFNSQNNIEFSILNSTLRNILNKIKSTRTMVITDACYSRKIVEECIGVSGQIIDSETKMDDEVLDSYLKSYGKVSLSSANEFQKASDGEPLKNSPFANALIKSLEARASKNILFDSNALYNDMLNYQNDKTKNKYFQSDMKLCDYYNGKGDPRFIFIPK